MALIPKVDNVDSVDKFRPIVLSNFVFKETTKVLVDRLVVVASRIVSPNQFGFI